MTSQIKQFDPDRINKICRDLQRDLDRALGEVEIYVGIAKDLTARINSKRQRLARKNHEKLPPNPYNAL